MSRTYRGVSRTRARQTGAARTAARALKFGVPADARPAVVRRAVRTMGGQS